MQELALKERGNHHKLFVNEHDSNKSSNCPQGMLLHFKPFQETMYAKTRREFIFVNFHDSMLKCSLNESFHFHFEDMYG